jgi:excinuclease ABC subunit B
MMRAIRETTRRRDIQIAYNQQHGITPESINSAVRALIEIAAQTAEEHRTRITDEERDELMAAIEDKMLSAAGSLDFEKAAKYRDELLQLRGKAPIEKEQTQPLHRRRSTRHH